MKILRNKLTIALSAFLCLAMLWGNGMVSYAAGETVTITSVSGTTTTVTVAGETQAAAVMVQIRDASDAIVAMQSFGTLDENFSGSITGLSLTAGATYTVYVADYEGGPWATQTVTPVQAAPGGESGSSESGSSVAVSPSPSATPTVTPENPTPTPSPSPIPTPSDNPGENPNPDDTGNSASPQTGDTGNMVFWFALMIAGGVSVVFLQRAIKKTKAYKKN